MGLSNGAYLILSRVPPVAGSRLVVPIGFRVGRPASTTVRIEACLASRLWIGLPFILNPYESMAVIRPMIQVWFSLILWLALIARPPPIKLR